MERVCKIVAAAVVMTVFMCSVAGAEVSVSYAYNDLFGTSYTNSQLFDSAYVVAPTTEGWTLNDMNTLQVMAMDTSSTADLSISINGGAKLAFFDTPAWTSPSRGYKLTDSINLAQQFGITKSDTFSLYVGNTLIAANNARMFLAPDPLQGFLIGFNDNGGWSAGDGDMNEPLLYGKVSPTPLPAALWLMGTGLLGLVGVRKYTTV